MRRYLLYLSVISLAFGIGVFVAFSFDRKAEEKFVIVQKGEEIKSAKMRVKTARKPMVTERLTCNEKSLQPFWNELSKHESFQDLDELYRWYDQREGKTHDCSEFFRVNEAADLNNDGRDEYLVQGINYGFGDHMTGDGNFYVFEFRGGKYEKILFDEFTIEQKIRKTTTNGYFDIETQTNNRLGSNNVSVYKFSGGKYKLKDCFIKTSEIFENGELKVFKKPLIERVKCIE